MPTPKPSPEYVASQKAKKAKAKKARDEMREEIRGNKRSLLALGRRKKKNKDDDDYEETDVEAATDASSPTATPVPASAAAPTATPEEARTLPERATVRYDKQGLMKKPKLIRRRINKPASKPFRPWKALRHYLKFKRYGKPNYSPDHRPAAPAPDAAPDAAPDTVPGGKP
jgi:hypothetical protein